MKHEPSWDLIKKAVSFQCFERASVGVVASFIGPLEHMHDTAAGKRSENCIAAPPAFCITLGLRFVTGDHSNKTYSLARLEAEYAKFRFSEKTLQLSISYPVCIIRVQGL